MGVMKSLFSGKQMSEAFICSAFLALSGGFQDAYTYNTRNEVFSNAQTGNVVLMSQNFMTGKWEAGLKYLFPLFAFALGVLIAEQIQNKYKYARRLHWRQVQSFRKVNGFSYASTMCIGNLRSGTAALSFYLREKKPEQLRQAMYYFGIIVLFAVGAGIGGNLSANYGIHMIWVSCGLLIVSFLLMFLDIESRRNER